MNFRVQHLRYILIIALVLAPVQAAFAAQLGMHAGFPADATSAQIQDNPMTMLDGSCSKHGKSGNCQSATHCGSCPVSLAISHITSVHHVMETQTHTSISGVSLYNADLLPDFRPPRYS